MSLAKNDLQLAETYYQEALTIRRELDEPHYLVEDWAGLAKVSLALGNEKVAAEYGRQILIYLKTNPTLDGAENPLLTFRFTWEALSALGQTREADGVLTLAAQNMQDYLNKNSDPALREMYLSQPHHQALWAAWTEKPA